VHGQRNGQLDFGGDVDHNPDPGFVDADREILTDSLFATAIPIDGEEENTKILGEGLNSLSGF